MSYQKIIILGNLGGDPEMRYLPDGTAITNFSMATNRSYTNKNGEKVDETTWVRVSVFGNQAEAVNQYLSQGSQVLVEGRLSPDRETGGPRVYTKNNGEPGASYEVRASRVVFVGSKGDTESVKSDTGSAGSNTEDEIPF